MKGAGGKIARKQRWGYVFIAPYFLVFLLFGVYPFLHTFILSFQSWDGLAPSSPAGMSNFSRLFHDTVFLTSLYNTGRIWLGNYIPQILSAIILSGIFTFNKVRGMVFFRAAYYLPNLITAASVGLLFNLLFGGDKSAVNQLLLSLGAVGKPIGFLTGKAYTWGIVSYIQWWMWFGYTTILIMAGMTTVDHAVYEAAMVDGAGKSATYLYITLPLIRPTVVYLTITSIIGGMQLFDVPAVLTDGLGAPQKSILTTAMYIYNQGFRNHNYGYACAVSIGLFVLVAALSLFSLRVMAGRGQQNDPE
jgi:multiple sugar transport system permease protein